MSARIRGLKPRLGRRPTSLRTQSHAEPALQRTDSAGFALLTVLWLIVTLTTLVGLSVAATRLGLETTGNRLDLARGRWAAEACLAILQARWKQGRLDDTATIDLGQRKRCRWSIADPTTKVNVNFAEREVLAALLADPVLSEVLERRRAAPFVAIEQIVGLAHDTNLDDRLTVDGPGSVNANAAPRAVLLALPGLGPEAVDVLLARRDQERPIQSLDELAGTLSPGARGLLLERYADLARSITFQAPQLLVTVRGWVTGRGGPDDLHATIEVLMVPLPERLAPIRRMMW